MSKNHLEVKRDERAITMSRILNAPRERVWEAYTNPELIPQWWGPRTHTTTVDQMDVRVGGVWRYISRDTDGNEYAFNGVYKKVEAPERLISTFEFEPMAGHISTDALILEELPDGTTKIDTRTTFDSLDDLDGMLQSGMEEGAIESWDRLEELVTTS
jgi:uncharacterized protein YndB with AHSA1/START domain